MFVSFDSLPDHARIWVYYIPRPLTVEEQSYIQTQLQNFCTHWEAHHNPLQTSFQLFENQFIILAVDETMHGASGCSIDGSVRIMREIGEFLKVDLFNRQYVAYWQEGKLYTTSTAQFKQMDISPETTVFDQTVTTLGEFRSRKQINIEKTWLKRYIVEKVEG
jgi:hypothetical protein